MAEASSSAYSPTSVAAQTLESSFDDYDYVFDNFSSLFSISFKNVQIPPAKDPSKSLLFLFESIAVQDIRKKKVALNENQLPKSQIFSQSITKSQQSTSDVPRNDSSFVMRDQHGEDLQKRSEENETKRKQNLDIQHIQTRNLSIRSISVVSPQAQQLKNDNGNGHNNDSKFNRNNGNTSQLQNTRSTHSRSKSDISFISLVSNQSINQNAEDFSKNQQQKQQLQPQIKDTQAPTLPSNLSNQQMIAQISQQPSQVPQSLKPGAKGYSNKRKVLKISSKPPSLIDPCQILHQHPSQIAQIESSHLKPNPSSCSNANPTNSGNYYLQNTGNFTLKNEASKKLQNTQPIAKKALPAIEDFNKTGKIRNCKENILPDTRGCVLDLTKNNPSIFCGTSKAAARGNSVRSVFPATTTSQENKKPLVLASITSKHQNLSNNQSQPVNGFTSNNNNNKNTKFNNINNNGLDKKQQTSENVQQRRLPSCMANKPQGEQYPEQNVRYESKIRNSSRDNSANLTKHLKDAQQSQNNHRFNIRNLVNPTSSSIKQEAVVQSLTHKEKYYGSKTAHPSLHQNEQVSNIRG